ncbi:alanine racemase [Acinetobacter sp. TGL-Y2]|uniref:alanine racemase n=1 Tax=Acinetobacter sp. TGL-Y2 TaxID=1407071 RepID=UPI0007A6627F|nr:alanine racemase [Acinetobacter sp. TGL-Y2]AMW78042.1 alanine racemase [Acinetobacter sp. TGL-Y2]
MSRPITAIIHSNALSYNLSVARQATPDREVFAVVKANAYGHGIERVFEAFQSADGFALLDIAEARRLRDLGWTGKILLLEGLFQADELEACSELQLDFTVHNDAQIEWLDAFSQRNASMSSSFHVFLKMNSGMNRLGFRPEAYRAAWHRLSTISCVESITHMTHFSDADGERLGESGVDYQVKTFESTIAGLTGTRSISNSAAILRYQTQLNSDYVRSGIMLYGSSPDYPAHTIQDWGLQPTMSLRSEIIAIQQIEAEQSVGYGSRFVAQHPMRIGVVACGYADGYQRTTQTGTPVLVDSQKTQILGRVSMDMLTVDLTHLPDVHIGSEVVLWGQSSQGVVLPVDEVAAGSGTVGYELMCGVTARVAFQIEQST